MPTAPAEPTANTSKTSASPLKGELVSKTFDFDGGRDVTVYIPPAAAEAVVFAGDGQVISLWASDLESAPHTPPTIVVGVHSVAGEMERLHEYSPVFEPAKFAAHAAFIVDTVRPWLRARFGVALPASRTAFFGNSAGGELAITMGLRHADVFGAVLCASPGAGCRPTGEWPERLPRAYFVAGDQEPFFRENGARWAKALREAGADVVEVERAGSHGDPFVRAEFPRMVAWAFGS